MSELRPPEHRTLLPETLIHDAVFWMVQFQTTGSERGFHHPDTEEAQIQKNLAYSRISPTQQALATGKAKRALDELALIEHRIMPRTLEELLRLSEDKYDSKFEN